MSASTLSRSRDKRAAHGDQKRVKTSGYITRLAAISGRAGCISSDGIVQTDWTTQDALKHSRRSRKLVIDGSRVPEQGL